MLDIFIWYIVIFLIGLVALPIGLFLFGTLKDYGYPFYRMLGVGFLTYLVWIFGSLKMLPFSIISVAVAFLVMLLISFFLVYFKKTAIPDNFLKTAFFYEVFFVILFIILTSYRYYHSQIIDIEKFMDFAFLNGLSRTSYFPPDDTWLAGNPINYYYFGHLIGAVLAKITNIQNAVVFNLMVVTNYLFYCLGIFSIIYNLTKTRFWGYFGVVVAALTANISYALALITGRQVGLWWAEATRIIPGTINEFPLYSFLLGDMHAHYLGLPFALMAILFIYLFFTSTKINKIHLFVFGLVLGLLFLINSWDYLVYAFFFAIVVIAKNGLSKKGVMSTIKEGLIPAAVSIIAILPFYLHFEPGSQGFNLVTATRTQLSHFVILFSLQIFVISYFILREYGLKIKEKRDFYPALAALFIASLLIFRAAPILPLVMILLFLLLVLLVENNKEKNHTFIYLLIFMSFIIIIFCEFFYLKDIYGIEYQRANTIFKLYYQLWLLLSISVAYIFYYYFKTKDKLNFIFFPISLFLLSASLMYLPNSIRVSADNFTRKWGLDGTKYLFEKHPYDAEGIKWLNENIKGPSIVAEKPGSAYTFDSRVSAYTGISTPIGWLAHQWGWRGDPNALYEIEKDIKMLYQTDSKLEANKILEKYKIEYIFIGERERESNLINDGSAILNIGLNVFSNEKVVIIKVKK